MGAPRSTQGGTSSFSSYLSFEESHVPVQTDGKQGVYDRVELVRILSWTCCLHKHAEIFHQCSLAAVHIIKYNNYGRNVPSR